MEISEDSEDHIINIENHDRKVWVIKLPDFLLEKWLEIGDEDVDLGSVRIYDPVPGKGAKVTLHLNKDPRIADIPKDYELLFLKNDKLTYVFSEANDTPFTIEGKVEQECHLRTSMTEEYRQVMKNRNVESNKPKRSVKLIDTFNDGIQVGLLPHIHESKLNRQAKKIALDNRRERLPKEELRDILFTAFEKYTHWHLKGLVEFTKQPNIYLKEILNEIAIFNRRGPYKNTYQLKPEYKATMNMVAANTPPSSQERRTLTSSMNPADDEMDQDTSAIEDESFEEEEEDEELIEETF